MFINELAKKLKITPRTIRHYEELGIIKTERLANNYRQFSDENIDKLKFIVRARKLGFSLSECTELIKLFKNEYRKSSKVREIAKNKLKNLQCKLKNYKAYNYL